MKRLSKFDIATLIERLPGNQPWSAQSTATTTCNAFTRAELVDEYNSLVDARGLDMPHIS